MNISFSSSIEDIVGKVAQEQAAIRMAHLEYSDFHDPETGERDRKTDSQLAREMFEEALKEVSHLVSHYCEYSADDMCQICGADGRA